MTIAEKSQHLDRFRKLVLAYRQTFPMDGQVSNVVLEDLRAFCRFRERFGAKTDYERTLLEGRREVFIRLLDYLELSPEELVEKYCRPLQP